MGTRKIKYVIYKMKSILGKSGEIAPERMKRLRRSGNDTELQICLVMKVKSNTVNTA